MPTTLVTAALALVFSLSSCLGIGFTLKDIAFLGSTSGGYYYVPSSYQMITNGLSVYWKCDEGSGSTLADSSGNGITATLTHPSSMWYFNLVNAPLHNTAIGIGNTPGAHAGATNGLLDLTNAACSISMWINRPVSAQPPRELMLYGQSDQYTNTYSWILYLDNTVQPAGRSYFRTLFGGELLGPDRNELTGDWMYLTVTRTNTTWTFYTNAVVCRSVNISTSYPLPSSSLFIGNNNYPTSTDGLRGFISEIAIYKGYCLTSNDVYYLYHNYYGRP